MAKVAPKSPPVQGRSLRKKAAPVATVPLTERPRLQDPVTTLGPRRQVQSGIAAMKQTHVRYDEWLPVWKRLGHLYEGDGPYLDGSALVPHARELVYKTKGDGQTDFSEAVGFKRKYLQRQALMRYENFAASILDLYANYQFLPGIRRSVGESLDGSLSPLELWWKDVDGMGTPIDMWLKQHQVLTNLYGHLFVVMDRLPPVTRALSVSPKGQKTRPITLAELGRPVLRRYMPPDALDWLAPRHQLLSVKFTEPVERTSLMQTLPSESEQVYFLWDSDRVQVFDYQGRLQRESRHLMGELPIKVWYANRRARYPIIGRSIIRDGSLFHDHVNLISEVRELFRSQVFSMLNIQLEKDETVMEAKKRLGDHAGVDAIVFTRGGAAFIAPESGPVQDYATAIDTAERKMYRLSSLPYDNDSRDAESAESRRRKSADLHASLSSLAANCQDLDEWIARMFYQATEGGFAPGQAAYAAAKVAISHPKSFDIEDMVSKAMDFKTVIDVGIGPTATKLLRMELATAALPDITEEDKQTVMTELKTLADQENQLRDAQHKAAVDLANNPPPAPVKGQPPAAGA